VNGRRAAFASRRDRRRRAAWAPSRVFCLFLLTATLVGQTWRESALTSFDEVWQTINDTYYDAAMGGLDWAGIKRELRPRAEKATSAEGVRDVIRDMLARLGQSHFALMSASTADDTLPGPARVPIDIRVASPGIVITRVPPDSTATRAGLRAGQLVTAIDGKPVKEMIDAAHGRDERMRRWEVWRTAFRELHGADGSQAELLILDHAGAARNVRVTRARDTGESVQLGNLPPLSVQVESRAARTPGGREAGVIGFNIWMTAIDAPVAAAVDTFRRADGLVIDLRGNPGGLALMVNGIAGHLIAEPVSLGTMQTRQATLHFKVNPRLVTTDGRRVSPFAGPVAILVDELTASASEVFAGGLQSLGRARIFGRQTLGGVLPASTKKLANGDVLMHAIGDFVTSTGKRLEGVGVIPDEVAPLSITALAAGQDEPLEAALRWIDTKVKGKDRPDLPF
jgi:carboxyl-terminal processing protease